MTPEEQATGIEQSALIADVLRRRAERLFEEAAKADVDDPVHDRYLIAQEHYEDYLRQAGPAIEAGLRWTAAEASREAAGAEGGWVSATADRQWNRYLDWKSDHHEELRISHRLR